MKLAIMIWTLVSSVRCLPADEQQNSQEKPSEGTGHVVNAGEVVQNLTDEQLARLVENQTYLTAPEQTRGEASFKSILANTDVPEDVAASLVETSVDLEADSKKSDD